MNTPPRLISLIVPVYKEEFLLREALASVQAQTFQNYEVICVDDGSPDNCGTTIDEFVRRDSRFHAVHHRNAGVRGARNRGLERVRGEYFLFLDPDDALCPDWFASFAKIIERDHPDQIRFATQRVMPETDWRKVQPPTFPKNPVYTAKGAWACCKALWPTLATSEFPIWHVAWRRECFKAMRFRMDTKFGEDALFNWWASILTNSIVKFDYPGHYYRYRWNSGVFQSVSAMGRARHYLYAVREILQLTWHLRDDKRLPFPILSYTPVIWNYAMPAKLKRILGIHALAKGQTPPCPARLERYIRNVEQGKRDFILPAVLARVAALFLLYAIEGVRMWLCLAAERVRGK